jgi:hypothetical protein
VRSALEAEPEAARLAFMQPRFEWPLCAAVRLGCSADIVRLLTENGAKVDATNVEGQSPLQLLSSGAETNTVSAPPIDAGGVPGTASEWSEWLRESTRLSEERRRESTRQLELDVATALLIAGADPEASHGDHGRAHCSSLELARRSMKDHLVGLYEQWTQ